MTNENFRIEVREAHAAEIAGWDELVLRFEKHRITHTSAWLQSLENSIGGKPVRLVFEKSGEIVGCLQGIVKRFGPITTFGSPLPGWQTGSMGPLFNEDKISPSEIVQPMIDYLEKHFGVHHIEITCDNLNRETMERYGFQGRIEYTFSAPLYPDNPKLVLKNMKSNARRNINRAERLGLVTRFRDDIEFVDEVFDQITEVFHRGGNTVPFSKRRVQEYFANMQSAGNLFAIAAYLPDGKTCIATGLFTIENKELIMWTWTHRTEHRWYRATELMTWTVMQKAMQLGCTKIDFSGRGEFKAKLGAKLDEEKIRWVRSRYQLLATARDMGEKVFRWQQALRGRLLQTSLFTKNIPAVKN